MRNWFIKRVLKVHRPSDDYLTHLRPSHTHLHTTQNKFRDCFAGAEELKFYKTF